VFHASLRSLEQPALHASAGRELIGQPHSIIRHPDMPRCIFKLLWERI
jgi:hypothetical protein